MLEELEIVLTGVVEVFLADEVDVLKHEHALEIFDGWLEHAVNHPGNLFGDLPGV